MLFLYIITTAALGLSIIADRQKTGQALKIAVKRFISILPDLLIIIVIASVVLFLIPSETIAKYLGKDNKYIAVFLAMLLGSVTMMPGFIAFPLCGLLLSQGIPRFVLGAFSTTLMMVGIVTFPLERSFLGTKTALIRNMISLLIAMIVAAVIGLFYQEIKI